MTDSFARFVVLSIDAQGYGRAHDHGQTAIQDELLEVLAAAAAAAGLDRRTWHRQGKGDEELALIPAGDPGIETRVVDDFVRELATVLFRRNRGMRCRRSGRRRPRRPSPGQGAVHAGRRRKIPDRAATPRTVDHHPDNLRATGFTTTRTTIAVAVSRRLAADTHPPAGDPATHAEHLMLLSRRLAEAGAITAALTPAREAVARYRQLPDIAAEPDPSAQRSPNTQRSPKTQRSPNTQRGLATALANLGNRLAEHGDAAEALAVTTEAAQLRRDLADAAGDGTASDGSSQVELAYAMNNQALRLLDTGRPEQAVAPAREAVELLDELAQTNPVHRPRLAVALVSLARVLAAAALPGEATVPAERAVQILRELAAMQPTSYLPDLAAALITLSQHLAPLSSRGKRTRLTTPRRRPGGRGRRHLPAA